VWANTATPSLRQNVIRTRATHPTHTPKPRSQRENTTVSNRKFASYNDYVLVHFYNTQ
jgi:hypothetical protein